MTHHHKKLERRTFSQDRYDILIKRQKSGKATFIELTELDEIVNRVPDIREKVIIENFMVNNTLDINEPTNTPGNGDNTIQQSLPHRSLWDHVKSIINRVFTSQFSVIDINPQLKLQY